MTFEDKYVNKIICGDCLEVMKDFPDNSVDLVLTDPPYGLNYNNGDLAHQREKVFGGNVSAMKARPIVNDGEQEAEAEEGEVMALKKQTGNMYEFVSHMWSPVKGRCMHNCSYCYMKRWGKQSPIHLDEKDLETDLGEGNFIFVCHTCDLFAVDIPSMWIMRVLEKTADIYTKNKYLFQTKNPIRYLDFLGMYPNDVILGTTIETNRDIVDSKAPSVQERAQVLACMNNQGDGYPTMITIEPIFDFDLDELVGLVLLTNPEWVNIGADSKGHGLPEPSKEKIEALIITLREKTEVKLKNNLKRLCPHGR